MSFILEISGDLACFTRAELKVERISYPVITPSAARNILAAILWKPAIRWKVLQIEILKPIQWVNIRRNEVGAKASTRAISLASARAVLICFGVGGCSRMISCTRDGLSARSSMVNVTASPTANGSVW